MERTRWPPQHPHAADAEIPILSAPDNHFGGAMNGNNRLFMAGADRMVVFLSGFFYTIRLRPSPAPSPSASL